MDYKHLSGGMPDLLLLRVEATIDIDNDHPAKIKLLDLSDWMDLNWNSLYKSENLKKQSYHSDIYSLRDPNAHVNNTQNLPEDSGEVKEDVFNDNVILILKQSNKKHIYNIFINLNHIIYCILQSILPSSLDANSKEDIDIEPDLFSPEEFFASSQQLITNEECLVEITGSSDRIESKRLNITTECIFVEVKGPTDTLSYRQHIWLQIMNEGGIDAWICKISEE